MDRTPEDRKSTVLQLPALILSAIVVFGGLALFCDWREMASIFPVSQALRLAVPQSDDAARFFAALTDEIASEHAHFRLSLIDTPSIGASAQALREQKTDLALARGDDPAAADGRAIFVMRSLYVAILVPASRPTESISQLNNKKIGVISDDGTMDPMARAVVDFYRLDDRQILRVAPQDLSTLLRRKQIAGVLVVGPTGAGPIADAIEAFRKSTGRAPQFVDIAEAKAIASRLPVYEEGEIAAGAFGGSPILPSADVATISTNVLMIARPSLANSAAGELTRIMLATKTRIASKWADAGRFAAPPVEKDALLPAHPGTVAFLNGEQSDLLDKSINLLFMGSMFTGFFGSFAAWLRSRRKEKNRGSFARLHEHAQPGTTATSQQVQAIEQALKRLSGQASTLRSETCDNRAPLRIYRRREPFCRTLPALRAA
jgi:TRAP-type uncharacterized transport system substrate-binding protein